MNKIFLLLISGVLSFGSVKAQTNIISADISFVFVSKDVEGTIDGFASESTIDTGRFVNSEFKGSVAVESLRTGNFLRDWSLKSSKYFDEDEYPKIIFQSTDVSEQDDRFVVKGLLKIKNISKEISIVFLREGNQLIGTMSIYSSDFGIDIKKKREDNLVEVKMSLTLEQ
jgi:polyisoprenoid-binding protein YceI